MNMRELVKQMRPDFDVLISRCYVTCPFCYDEKEITIAIFANVTHVEADSTFRCDICGAVSGEKENLDILCSDADVLDRPPVRWRRSRK